ncbi:hypothetical protein [Nannocystis radixulma]|uniref:Cytochrome c domain-containing protein n=1 Tax=Nannocystis radixulma TaxID=2995305 RepID=A0ABT5B8C1_9BACT|nr:hypothetical protein [Nannocystis radixulma]MDC0669276.1 hypothetical protein [Nannocystis radixulma]
MKKLAFFTLAAAAVGPLVLTSVSQDAQADGGACVRTQFKTTSIKDACTKGGQAEAKKVMKKFMATAKVKVAEVKDCKSCHTTLTQDWKLTDNALELFIKAGGK